MVLEIHRVIACQAEGGRWAWNSAQYCGRLRTNAYDVRRAIKRALGGMGVRFGGTHTCIICDDDRYEVRVIATGEPLYIAVRATTAPQALKSISQSTSRRFLPWNTKDRPH